MYHVITESWGLEKITDALPGTLNPHRHKDAFEWGPDLLFKLHELAQLTPGRHARVVEGLKLRVSQRHSSVRPNFAPWTIPEDVQYPITTNRPRPADIPQIVNRNAIVPNAGLPNADQPNYAAANAPQLNGGLANALQVNVAQVHPDSNASSAADAEPDAGETGNAGNASRSGRRKSTRIAKQVTQSYIYPSDDSKTDGEEDRDEGLIAQSQVQPRKRKRDGLPQSPSLSLSSSSSSSSSSPMSRSEPPLNLRKRLRSLSSTSKRRRPAHAPEDEGDISHDQLELAEESQKCDDETGEAVQDAEHDTEQSQASEEAVKGAEGDGGDQSDHGGDHDDEPAQPGEQEIVPCVEDATVSIAGLTFEERHPIPASASRRRRASMLRLLKKRNQRLRHEGSEHIDHELDYRIQIEEALEEEEDAVRIEG